MSDTSMLIGLALLALLSVAVGAAWSIVRRKPEPDEHNRYEEREG